jgi:hypothetical protein
MNNENYSATDFFDLPGTLSGAEYIQRIRIQAHWEQTRMMGEILGRAAAAIKKFLAAHGAAGDLARMSDHDLADIGISRGDLFPGERTNPIADTSGTEILGLSKWSPLPGDASNDGHRRVA